MLDGFEVLQIARHLATGRPFFKNLDGLKTFCPLCDSGDRKARPTFSIAVRDGIPLFFCHRCNGDGKVLIRELVRRGLLPNNFRESSMALALIDEVRAATAAVIWKGIAATTDLKVLQALFEIIMQCCKLVFNASARQVSGLARVDEGTASRSLWRLVRAGWLEQISRARGAIAATWRLRIPPDSADRDATIKHAGKAGNGLLQIDPCFTRGDRAGSSRSAPPFDHDLFRCGKGLGPTKGRIYWLLGASMTAGEMAKTLGYKHTRNVRHHLQGLAKERLVRRLDDAHYQRTDVDLDAVAARRGVLGAGDRQRARHRAERVQWRRWSSAFEHWRQTGQIIDPETGEILESQDIPGKWARMRAFRCRVLSIRAARKESNAGTATVSVDEDAVVSEFEPETKGS